MRLTLAIVFVKPQMDKLAILKRLLSALRAAQISIKCLYADKGFCCIPVLHYLSPPYPGDCGYAHPWQAGRQS